MLGVAAFPLIWLKVYGKPPTRGFYCDDEELAHPYKDSTISSTLYLIIGLTVPLAFILIVEQIFPPLIKSKSLTRLGRGRASHFLLTTRKFINNLRKNRSHIRTPSKNVLNFRWSQSSRSGRVQYHFGIPIWSRSKP
jgi:hypothetical protein